MVLLVGTLLCQPLFLFFELLYHFVVGDATAKRDTYPPLLCWARIATWHSKSQLLVCWQIANRLHWVFCTATSGAQSPRWLLDAKLLIALPQQLHMVQVACIFAT